MADSPESSKKAVRKKTAKKRGKARKTAAGKSSAGATRKTTGKPSARKTRKKATKKTPAKPATASKKRKTAARRSPARPPAKHEASRGAASRDAPSGSAAAAAERILGANPFVGLDAKEIADAVLRLARLFITSPKNVVREQVSLLGEIGRVMTGQSDVAPPPDDRRFQHEIWQKNGYFRRLMQSFIAWRQSLRNVVDDAPISADDRHLAQFALALFTEAFSPTNTLLGNPGALARIVETRGKSLLSGAKNMLRDVITNRGMPSQIDKSKFEVGANLAVTPGQVVFRNDVMEIIQYAPQSGRVHARPVLLIPPQINKFYIADLAPGRSLVEYAVQNDIQFFAISWRNPTAAQRDWNLETYVDACKEAIHVARSITGADKVNLMAACAGGYTAVALLGHLEAIGEAHLVETITLMVTMLDTRSPTLLGMFASKNGIALAIQRSRAKGVLDGDDMGRMFSWLRPNDLVWMFVANNWLMGNAPPAFDILYWNADTTRLPAEFHADILAMFMDNPMARPHRLKLLGTAIDTRKIKQPAYIVAGITDHITPWKACYGSTQLLGGKDTFVLTSTGHIQSIVNTLDNPKSRFFTDGEETADPDKWLSTAKQYDGSWWPHWREFYRDVGGELRDAPDQVGNDLFPPIEAAPGRYVHQR